MYYVNVAPTLGFKKFGVKGRDIMLSKSKYCAFLECPKKLWLRVNKPELEEISDDDRERMKNGNAIGDLAMSYFGDFTEVTTLKDDGRLDLGAMIEKTDALIKSGCNVICEASFSYNGSYCAVDILKKEDDGYSIYEVKSSKVKDKSSEEKKALEKYSNDIAYQKYVLEKSGIKVVGTYLVRISHDYVFDGELDIHSFFKVDDVCDLVEKNVKKVENGINEAIAVLNDSDFDERDCICKECCDCGFFGHCSRNMPKPNVFDLFGTGFDKAKKEECYKKGLVTFDDLRGEVKSGSMQEKQIEHCLNDLDDYINKDEIKSFLDGLSYPLYFLDFESMNEAIPTVIGTRPYQQIAFQYSLHYINSKGGELCHKEFLAESGTDPRLSLAQELCQDIQDGGTVLVYNKTFEGSILKRLAEDFPQLAERLNSINGSIKDLYKVFSKGYYYNRAMGSSLSIKSVLPALFPNDSELDYHSLDGVHNGAEAMTIFPKIKDMPLDEQLRARQALLKYCELDTLAMVKVWQRLTQVCE